MREKPTSRVAGFTTMPPARPRVDPNERRWAAGMRAADQGNPAAYEKMLGEVAGVLRGVVARRLARLGLGTAETEDIVQEVLIAVHDGRHSWIDTQPFLPWLYAIVHYKFVDAARRLGRDARRRFDVSPEDWGALFAAPEVDMDRATVDVGRYLDTLPETQRQVVQALAIEGTSVKATAERFRTTEGTIRMTLHRALAHVSSVVGTALHQSPRAKKP